MTHTAAFANFVEHSLIHSSTWAAHCSVESVRFVDCGHSDPFHASGKGYEQRNE